MGHEHTESKTIYLKDYLPSEYTIDHVELDIDLQAQNTVVRSKLTVKKNPASQANTKQLTLAGDSLELQQVKLNNKVLTANEYTLTKENLSISNLPEKFTLEITSITKPALNTALSGLYKTNGNYCTQCEAEGFRRITYYLDRPDVMATFVVTIHGDRRECPVLLANGNLIAQGLEENNRHYATWEDPFPKPCYLFAMVAGDLVAAQDKFITMSGRIVTIQIFVERENLAQTPHALAAVKKAMLWDEQAYGREYDLDIYMIVAVNDFNMGAMENKGLNIFNSKYILVSPATATDFDYAHVDLVVGHEYFHNWSGNRVTCRDWFQLSLKEGFTVFREQQFTQAITESPVVRIDEVKNLITRQFAEDSGPLAHPVRPDSYMEINNFYTMTIYEKGAEVIRMMHTLLGPEKFRKGTDLYFARNDGHAVTTDDFVAALQEASGIDLSQFKLWYTQAGTPELTVATEYDPGQKTYTLNLTQMTPPTPGQPDKQALHIPIALGLLDANGNDIPIETPVLSLTKPEQKFVFKNIAEKPHLSILRDFSAPVRLKHSVSDEDLAFLLAKDNDNFNRWYAGQKLYTNTLLNLVKDVQNKTALKLSSVLIEAFRAVLLDDGLNLSLKAELLTPPSMQLLIDSMQVADPDAIYAAKKFLVTTIANEMKKELIDKYDAYTLFGPFKYTAEDAAHRSCRNTIFGFLTSTKTREAIVLANDQYNKANNMTDKIAALSALANIECDERIEALVDFYDDWSSNPLVINKWLSIQATADLDDTLDQVKSLMQHAAFDIKNPNKVYALIGGFGIGNPVKFHAKDGAGYNFITDIVIQLNSLNPQVAARMLNPLTNWKKFTPDRQEKMQKELLRIKQADNLSSDVMEIVTKALV
jgi:aminopeptidase N